MVQCNGCSSDFPRLDTLECSKCTRKRQVPSAQWGDIDKLKSCDGCGVTYTFLGNSHCSSCINAGCADSQIAATVSKITHIADFREQDTSRHRLHQTTNANLLMANREQKEKSAVLRKQNKRDTLQVEFSVWYWPKKGTTPKRIQMNGLLDVFRVDLPVDLMIDSLIAKAMARYHAIPNKPLVLFDRETLSFTVMKNSKDHCDLDPSLLSGNVNTLFQSLVHQNLVASKAVQEGKLVLRMLVYEKDTDNEEDSDDAVIIPIKRPTSAPPTSPPQKKKKKKLPAPSIQFRSAYRHRKLENTKEDVAPYDYEAFQFTRIECSIDEDGTTHLKNSTVNETISIVRGWQNYKDSGKPGGGYLSKGFTKYAFRGKLEGIEYAIFQSNPILSFDFSNEGDLLDELKLLNMAQYFLNLFIERAEQKFADCLIPNISWNVADTFVGQLVNPLKLKGEAAMEDPSNNLLYTHFLAAPLLPIENRLNREVRFCGNEDVVNSKSSIGQVIDAFLHAALQDSDGNYLFSDIQGLVFPGSFPHQRVVLFDPQAHTKDQTSGHWDRGRVQIEKFICEHRCNFLCHTLELDNLSKLDLDKCEDGSDDIGASTSKVSLPLRHGFPTP